MKTTLHIVSNTTVVEIIKRAKLFGDFLVWQDFLHEGPVPLNFSLKQVSKIRAYFLDEYNYTPLHKALKLFEYRNNILESHQKYKKITLWFEKNLYDQLQLLQILDWFEKHLFKGTRINLVLTDKPFNRYSLHRIESSIHYNQTIHAQHLQLSKKAWASFSDTTPLSWFKLLNDQRVELLSLKYSIQRLLEEYPNTINGLSRTEHQALLTISTGEKKQKEKIFIESQKHEKIPFIPDVVFWKILDSFIEYKLIVLNNNQDCSITDLGIDVLSGKKNWIAIKKLNYWIGGVQLTHDNLWCWNIQKKCIAKYYYSKPLSMLIPVKKTLEVVLHK